MMVEPDDSCNANSLEENDYDQLITGWVKYWNEVLKTKIPLDPNFVKALMASESSFNSNQLELCLKYILKNK